MTFARGPSRHIYSFQHGADPTIRNSEGKTPLELAESSTKAVLNGEYKKDDLLEASRYLVRRLFIVNVGTKLH